MDWLVVAVQWLHVLLGILWFGNALVLDVIVIPAINRLPIVSQREIASHIGARATPIFHVVVPAIIVLGIIRGTVLGPIKSVDVLLGSAYGLTWLTALVATVLTYLFGLFVIVPALRRMDLARLEPRRVADARARRGDRPCQAARRLGAHRLSRHLHLHDPHALRSLTGRALVATIR